MKKTALLLLLSLVILISSAQGQKNCASLKTKFKSYNEALIAIQNTKFLIEDEVNTSTSSWIRSASYYSCDGKVGYFILGTDKRDYIHANLPFAMWKAFKQANSFGSYYNTHIKNRYQLTLSR
jgi:hypothetical protein